MKKNTIILTCTLATLLSGCAAKTDFRKDVRDRPEAVKMDEKEHLEEINRVSYLVKPLMEEDNRAEIIKEITGSEVYIKQMNTGTEGAIASAAVNIHQGTTFSGSTSASQVQLAVTAVSLLLGEYNDGSNEITAKAWLPSVYDGKTIETPEDAEQVAIKFTEARIQEIAKKLDWSYSCIDGCGTSSILYHFENTKNITLPESFIYRPDEFIILVQFVPGFKKVKEHDPVKVLIGPEVAWESRGITSYHASFYAGNIEKNEDGSVAIYKFENGRDFVNVKHNIAKTKLGYALYQTFHSTPYTVLGDARSGQSSVFYNNKAYTFYSNSRTQLTRYELDIEDLHGNKILQPFK